MGEDGSSERIGAVTEELKALRKGYGVESRDIAARIGPELRLICGLAEDDSQPAQRAKIVGMLMEAVAVLPEHLADAAILAFGMRNTGDRRFEERMAQMADSMNRDARTARRHVDHLMTRIAETLLYLVKTKNERPAPEWTWHNAELSTVVLVDAGTAEVIEQRRIVSRIANLVSVDWSMTVAEHETLDLDTLGLRVIHGAVLGAAERVGSTRLEFNLGLPRPLGVGEEHVIMIGMRLPGAFAPYYVCTPTRPCERFDLVVRFAPGDAPLRAWRLDNELPIDLTDPLLVREPLVVDAVGEVRTMFTGLTLNRSHGIGWEPAGPR